MIRPPAKTRSGGFTLAETLIAAAVSSIVLAGIAGGAVALRRTYEAANYHMNAQTEQLRVFDYVGRDLRAAATALELDQGRRLDLVIPANSNGSLALQLALPVVGTLRTTTASNRNVSYVLEGDRLIRTENGVSREVARTVTDFRVARVGLNMEVAATFSPKFSRSPLTSAQQAMKLKSCFLLRNR
jgi:type II secretory pathway component PulJ